MLSCSDKKFFGLVEKFLVLLYKIANGKLFEFSRAE